jgi:methylglyoxal synthase
MATIALIAHDGKKVEMVEFAKTHLERLAQFDLIATGSTGRIVSVATGLTVKAVRHGPGGGDVQIAAQILEGHVQAVFFFVEPMEAHPHDPDIQTLMRICNIENVPLATNPATADLVIKGFGTVL